MRGGILHRLLGHPVILTVGITAALAVGGYSLARDLSPHPHVGIDYCAAANLRTCKVADHGDGWTVVSDGVTNTFIIELVKDGKVVQVIR